MAPPNYGAPEIPGRNSETTVPTGSFPSAAPNSPTQPIKIVKPAEGSSPTQQGPSGPLAPSTPGQPDPNSSGPSDGLFPQGPSDTPALPKEGNPLDKYNHAIAYRVQTFDNLNRIADAHATTPEELIKLNGRTGVKRGEMIVVPVDDCMIKNK